MIFIRETSVAAVAIVKWRGISTARHHSLKNSLRQTTNFVNERWTVYAGMSFERAWLGWSTAMHPDDWLECNKRREKALATGQIDETEYRLKRSDGLYRWHLARAVPFKDASGRITTWFGTCTDIDEQKRAQLALRDPGARGRVSDTQPPPFTIRAARSTQRCHPSPRCSAIDCHRASL